MFDFGNTVTLATSGNVFIGDGVQILGGDVIANSVGSAIDIGENVDILGGKIAADAIDIGSNSVVGNVFFNDLDLGIDVLTGSQNTPLTLPVIDPAEFPDFQPATPGTDDIIVGENQTVTINPGDFDEIIVGEGGTLILDGEGIYNFDNVLLSFDANLLYEDPVDVRIDDNIGVLKGSTIGAANSSSIEASDAVFYFGGSSGFNLAFFGNNTDINGTFYGADNSLIRIGQEATATGSFVASDIIVQKDAVLMDEALVSYNLFWTGDAGYSMTGMFGFDDQSIPVDGIIRKDQLEFMMISFFDPSDVLLQRFNYDFPNPDTSGEFSFNFNTVTGEVIQSGFPIGPEGLDLGIDNSSLTETGLDFYSCGGDAAVEGECIFSSLGEGIILQRNDVEGACFNFPNSDCVDLDGGGVVTAELKIVPEADSLVVS